MQAANGVFTCFRSVSRLIGSEVAGTSGSQDACFERLASAASWSVKKGSFSSCGGSFSTPAAYLMQTSSRHCMHSHAGSSATARQLVHQARSSPATNSSLRSLLLNKNTYTFRTQHSLNTQASVKSLWQRDYYSSGSGYRRSYSIWDGDNVLYGLIAANLAGFLLWQSYPGLMYRHATVSVNSVREGRVYTLLTSAFSHNAFNHILANMVTFYFFGRTMSHVLGGKKVTRVSCCCCCLILALHPIQLLVCAPQLLLLYLAGGLAGSLAHVTQYYIQAQSTGKLCSHTLLHKPVSDTIAESHGLPHLIHALPEHQLLCIHAIMHHAPVTLSHSHIC